MSGKKSLSQISLFQLDKSTTASKIKSSNPLHSQKFKKIDPSKAQFKTHLIKKFQKNHPKKSNKQKRFSQILQNSVQSISDQRNFTCPICLEILISPVIFQCGHFGCLKCIETVSVYQNKCFLCRKIFENLEYKPSDLISDIINKTVVKNIDNPIEYYTRLADHLQWPKKKQLTLKQVQIGCFVDIRCSSTGKWKNAVVIYVENSLNSKYFLKLKYKHQNGYIEEFIDIGSSRLAKSGFYTQQRAIQASNEQPEETEVDIPQISIENFQRASMDRNLFFAGRKQENYFSETFGAGDEFGVEQKVVTPDSVNGQEVLDYFQRDLQELLNPQKRVGLQEPELLEVYF